MELSPTQQTALGAARMRAAHLVVDGQPKIYEDTLALDVLGVSEDELREWYPGYPTAVWVQRSRYAEDLLAVAYGAGVRQYVLLGAGLDTYGLRAPPELGELCIFEIDEPTLQAWKLARLDEVAPDRDPSRVAYLPCDFESSSAEEALARSDFRSSDAAVVSWLGVTQYLSAAAIETTLRWFSGLARGSLLVFTYVVPEAVEDVSVQVARAQGSTFNTFFSPSEIEDVLTRTGLLVWEHCTPDEFDERYFAGRDDVLHASPIERSIVAQVR